MRYGRNVEHAGAALGADSCFYRFIDSHDSDPGTILGDQRSNSLHTTFIAARLEMPADRWRARRVSTRTVFVY